MSYRNPVTCSECGKVLNGIDRGRGLGIEINNHAPKGAEPWSRRDCPGARRRDHQPKPRKSTAPTTEPNR